MNKEKLDTILSSLADVLGEFTTHTAIGGGLEITLKTGCYMHLKMTGKFLKSRIQKVFLSHNRSEDLSMKI
jgi:hypothetical protein